nr:calcium ion binding protein, putative [Ipomoea batatas]
MKKKSCEGEVLDGSDIMELVGNEEVFSNFVDHKFQELDKDCDGKLSVKELQPAVADIGAALGLPAQGSSPKSDHIYSEVLNEFTHGKQEKVSKTEFKEVLSDILLGMATGLKRDPIVILRMDGEDLLEFINNPSFESDMSSICSFIELPDGSLKDYIVKVFEKLSVDQGMPPASDSWVMSNIVEPALGSDTVIHQEPVSQDSFLAEFKKVAVRVAQRLKEQPVIVAHSENTFDGSGIRRLLANKFELDKVSDFASYHIIQCLCSSSCYCNFRGIPTSCLITLESKDAAYRSTYSLIVCIHVFIHLYSEFTRHKNREFNDLKIEYFLLILYVSSPSDSGFCC